jgi:hypothetical protein
MADDSNVIYGSQLPLSQEYTGAFALGISPDNKTVKIPLDIIDQIQQEDTTYKSIRQVNAVELSEDVAVATEMGETDEGGAVEYYATCGFMLKTSDGKYWQKWATRWWYYDDSGKIRQDVLYLCGSALWQWTGDEMRLLLDYEDRPLPMSDDDVDSVFQDVGMTSTAAEAAMTAMAVSLGMDDEDEL